MQKMNIKIIIASFFLATNLFASPNFKFNNDFFAPGGKDRYLTNDFFLDVKVKEGLRLGIGSEMYTPDNLRTSEIEKHDHPYSGYTYISLQEKQVVNLQEKRLYEIRIGLLGDASKAKRLQKFVHNDLDLGTDPKGWDNQNGSELAIDLMYAHQTRDVVSSFVGATEIITTQGFRIGNVVTEYFIDTEVNKIFYEKFVGFVGIDGHFKLFDTHIEGRLFSDNIHTKEAEYFVAGCKAGVAYKYEDYKIGFQYLLQTRTFREQPDNHLVGSVFITKDF